jgi:class 3 adenylate cyclase/tetratricopeptide (TPR) repeat protein
MRCANCAAENASGNKFCTSCGSPLEMVCSECGRACQPTARFCGWCGAPRTSQMRVIEPAGERKQATVLFADIVGSTELIAGLDAEQASSRLQPAVAAMAQAVRRFDGTILGRLGDGLKAIFGAPRAQEGHTLLACQAALAMREAMALQPNPIKIRIGLHSGEVVAGALSSDTLEQEAQGITLHIASRIEQAADSGGIFLSAACRDLVAADCDTEPAGRRQLKGISEPLELFRLIRVKPGVASDRFRDVGLTQLRGRQQELAFLKQALLDAEQGAGSAIAIVAPSGIGKSRLCYEFGEWCRERKVEVLEARAHVFGRSTPLLPVFELMRAFFHITPALDAAVARQKIEEKLLALDASFATELPLLADFLGLPAPELEGQRVDSKVRHTRLRSIVQRMVKASGRRTSVIVFEDLHWLDEPSQDFVETIVEAVSGTNIVIVLNYRPTWTCPWLALSHYRQLPLTELDRTEINRLVRDLMGDDPALEGMIAHVARQSDGNPFFAEELVHALAQSGVLVGERGHYRLACSDHQDPVLPATIEAAIGARLDLLPEREKTVLQIGAVIGKEYPAALAREVVGASEPEAKKLFDRLCDLDLIKACDTAHGPGFAFRHPLIQEVAYAMQLRAKRTRLHAAVAKAIEGFSWGQLDECAGLLAHHCEAAGQPLEAAKYLRRAALLIGKTNSAQAFADWKKVRRLLRELQEGEANDQLRAQASGRILTLGWAEGMAAEEAKRYAEEALRFARGAGDQTELAISVGAYGRILSASGAADEYVSLVREALATIDPGRDQDGSLALNALLSQAYLHAGLLRQGLAANDVAALEASKQLTADTVFGLKINAVIGFDVPRWVRCLRVRILVLLGRLEEAEATLASALQVAPGDVYPVVQAVAHMGAVDLAWHRRDVLAASWHAAEIANYAAQSGIPYIHTMSIGCRALAESIDGSFASAISHFREALVSARRSRAGLDHEAKLLAFLADTLVRAGDHALAARVAAEALEVARRRTDRLAELHASIVAARALSVDGGPERRSQADRHLGRAEDLMKITGAAIFKPLFQQAMAGLTA